jgi:hypothetical protein
MSERLGRKSSSLMKLLDDVVGGVLEKVVGGGGSGDRDKSSHDTSRCAKEVVEKVVDKSANRFKLHVCSAQTVSQEWSRHHTAVCHGNKSRRLTLVFEGHCKPRHAVAELLFHHLFARASFSASEMGFRECCSRSRRRRRRRRRRVTSRKERG